MKRFGLAAVAAAAAVSASPALAAPQCVEMRFLDAAGVVLPVNPPLVGIMIGDGPLFEGRPPEFASVEPGRFVDCPQTLIDSAQKAFVDFCSSGDRREKAAAANKVDISVINKRCGDLTNALK